MAFLVNNKFEDVVKENCSENFVIFAEKCPWESLLNKLHYIECRFFLMKSSVKYDFLKIYEIFKWLTVKICAAKCD